MTETVASAKVINALFAPARAINVRILFELFDEAGNLVRVVLQVAVHGKNEVARGVIEAGGERRRLTEVAAELDYQQRGYRPRRDFFSSNL